MREDGEGEGGERGRVGEDMEEVGERQQRPKDGVVLDDLPHLHASGPDFSLACKGGGLGMPSCILRISLRAPFSILLPMISLTILRVTTARPLHCSSDDEVNLSAPEE